ncbi:hypothetical protein [Shewanella surugensis]|uniref:Uncharacterized protein n=1 Tax=Shewanella surugensis TaxID=212020 RepID=A0ABT0L7J2_9GAMM|nr:hypothetical protein [Shewanella surugensis]MCL1123663.1 hypothetical protein [Shewanella surugensis]
MRLTLSVVLVGILGSAMSSSYADEADIAFSKELSECSAYYDIASSTLSKMNVPQMQNIAEKLSRSKIAAFTLAEKYQTAEKVQQQVEAAKKQQMALLPDDKSLMGLMEKYRQSCQSYLTQPEQRLSYWQMATM